jgi:hypothetical protein
LFLDRHLFLHRVVEVVAVVQVLLEAPGAVIKVVTGALV